MESMDETSETLSSITTSEATATGPGAGGAGGGKVGNFLGGAVKAAKRFCSVVWGIFSRASSMPPNLAKSLILRTSLAI